MSSNNVKLVKSLIEQVLPYASEETLMQLEENLRRIPSVTQMLHDGMTPRDMTDRILTGLGSGTQGFSLQPRLASVMSRELRIRSILQCFALNQVSIGGGGPALVNVSLVARCFLWWRHS